jgi:hypothetical protein
MAYLPTSSHGVSRDLTRSGLSTFARLGYAAKGVVYVLIGALAALAAVGHSGAIVDANGAVRTIYQQPFGQALLYLTAIGLFGYVLWCLARALNDPSNRERGARAAVRRIRGALSGIPYALLGLFAIQVARGADVGQTSDGTARDWTARLLYLPLGPLLVGVATLVVLGLAFAQFVQAYSGRIEEEPDLQPVDQEKAKQMHTLGRIGFAARGLVLCVVSFFLLTAAFRQDPGEARGLGGALQSLAQQPLGPFLLGVVALGLVAYGVFSLTEARYFQLRQS